MSCCDIVVVENQGKFKSTPFFIRFSNKARIADVVEIYVPQSTEIDYVEEKDLSFEEELQGYQLADLSMRLEADQIVPHFDRVDVIRMKKKKVGKPGKKLKKTYTAEEEVTKKIHKHHDKDQQDKVEKIAKAQKTKAEVVNMFLNSEQRLLNMTEDMVYDPIMLTPTSNEVKLLNLKQGFNRIKFAKRGSDNQISEIATGHIFVWSQHTNIVLCDIDGTVTKSDKIGILKVKLGDATYIRPGIAALLSSIAQRGYKIVYLTARAITQGRITREFLLKIEESGVRMPIGPIITSYNTFTHAALREYLYHRSDTFKIGSLKMFRELFPDDHKPFVAGFGNKPSDHQAYLSVGIRLDMIYIIDKDGQINKLSEKPYASYTAVQKAVETLFPNVATSV